MNPLKTDPEKELLAALKTARALGEPDPEKAAEQTQDQLSEIARDFLFSRAWASFVRMRWGNDRRARVTPALERSYYVSKITPRWSYLRDCTRLQVQVIAESYRRAEAENADYARRFEQLGKAMDEQQVETVGALGDGLVEAILDKDEPLTAIPTITPEVQQPKAA